MTVVRQPTWSAAGDIINRAAIEVGLSDVSDPFSSTDPNIKQMCYLLKSQGKELVHLRNWNHLRKEYHFTTVAGQSEYDLPADFHNMIDQTWWNRTNRLPVGGPLSSQEWQYLRARMVGVVFNVLFRPYDRAMKLYPETNTPGGYDIYYEYNSRYWVSSPAAIDTLISDEPTQSDQLLWFDDLILIRGVKLQFLKAKGFDTTAAQQDFNAALEYMKGADSISPTLNATRRFNPVVDPLIGGQSVPVTGFGV